MDTRRFFLSRMKWVFVTILLIAVVGLTLFTLASRRNPTSGAVSQTSHGNPTATLPSIPTASPKTSCTLLPNESPPDGVTLEFKTDFTKHCVPYSEILSGGPGRDGIPALDASKFVSVNEANGWIQPVEPVIFFQVGNDARAYPIQIIIWHEVINDTVGGVPVAITFCPLCNTAIAYERTVNGQVLDFGTTGRLRFSNLLMYDRQTESWWQQALGQAIIGKLTGTKLVSQPAVIISWATFRAAHPDGKVFSRNTGYQRPYGQNPYRGYDDINQSPFLYVGPPTPGQLPSMARVVVVVLNGEAVAYPFDTLRKVHVVNDTIGKTDVVVLWTSGTSSPLDTDTVPSGRDVGSATVYLRTLDGQHLTFAFDGTAIVDKETGSVWDILGRAKRGQLAGKSLTAVVASNSFWFAWAVYRPDTRVYQP